MDKKFDISYLKNHSDNFIKYLSDKLSLDVKYFLNHLLSHGEVIIFSGVIRNYFLNYQGEVRDLDLVIKLPEDIDIESILNIYNYKRNSFNGFKININNTNVDLWEIENTWALKTNKVELELFDIYALPNTSFFNFSSVIFRLNYTEFIANKDFFNFIESKEIDLVLTSNPLPQLCIVNTIYYHKKYQLKISNNLKTYFINNFNLFNENQYNQVQIKHFDEIIFNYTQLLMYYKSFKKEMFYVNKNLISQNI